ncbi:hypothetical protein D3C86_1939660 [compost metagenome]
MPSTPVINPPVLKSMRFGHMLAKSLAGETTLAAMLTEMVATMTVNMATATIQGLVNWPTSCTGSQKAWP